jgi:hypothetical protein
MALQAPKHFLIGRGDGRCPDSESYDPDSGQAPGWRLYLWLITRTTSGERRREERTMTAQPAVNLGLYALEDLLMQHCGPDDGSRTCPQVRKDRADHRTGDRTEL